MNDISNKGDFVRTSRNFTTDDPKKLAITLDYSYIELARAINSRTIGFYSVNRASATGENWYISENKRQQGFRQVYTFSDSNLKFPYGINNESISYVVRLWGMFFDGNNWQTLPYVDVTNVTNQISLKINTNTGNLVVLKGAGTPPAIVRGLVVLEWIGQP